MEGQGARLPPPAPAAGRARPGGPPPPPGSAGVSPAFKKNGPKARPRPDVPDPDSTHPRILQPGSRLRGEGGLRLHQPHLAHPDRGFKTTTYIYNGSGQPATIDPPGFGAADATTFTYNLTGRNGYVADTRIDPLVGTTTFGYDGLNRRTSVTDPNNVQTTTAYDALSRVTEMRRKGAVPADDLVTTSTYNAFGDLFCTKLPKGNGVEYVYDEAGRLKQMIRGTAVATPTSTTCLDTAQPRERTIWLLDGAGNRTEESLERWTGAAWVSESKTTFTYTCHLDKVTKGAGSAAPSVTEYCYDLNDNLVFVWDPNHPKATNANPTQLYTFDELNRLKTVTAGSGTPTAATTHYDYDVQDHLTWVKDAEGNETTYTFSDRDLMTQQVSPVSGTTTYTYNEHGRLDVHVCLRRRG